MKKLKTSKSIMARGIVTGAVASCLFALALVVLLQLDAVIAVCIALGLSAVFVAGICLFSDKGISFDEEKFVVRGGREYYYHEIDEVKVKTTEIYLRDYKAIIVDGEEVCFFDDLYQNAKEFTAILEKHGFTVPADRRMMN